MATIKEEIKRLLEKSIKGKQDVLVEIPRDRKYGDYSSNVAFNISKNPVETAESIKNSIKSDIIERVETKSGFINFFVSKDYLLNQVKTILKEKDKFGSSKIGKNQKINVEFISANPTGPLTLGNGRGGFCGDVLSNVLEKAGYKVTREYYVNNVGEQIKKLGHSVLGDSLAVYKGKYIDDLRNIIKEKDPEKVGKKASYLILSKMIKPSVKKMGVKFDVWFEEKKLEKEIDKVLGFLKKKNLTYTKDNALWFKSTRFGDDKDRVLIKENKEKTYLDSDLAYLENKFKRGFKKIIFFWGADHYGYVSRVKAGAEALGYDKNSIEIIIMQLVRLLEAGKEVRMSKRSGIYVTIDELIDEVGLDSARFFFLMRNPDSHLNFDMDLAKKKSEENPVYYVQYAGARISSILKKAKTKVIPKNLELLKENSELNLIKQLIKFPDVVSDTALDYKVDRLAQYVIELADCFHQFYENCRVITDDKKLTQARLSLISATKIIINNTFDLMGISSPDKM